MKNRNGIRITHVMLIAFVLVFAVSALLAGDAVFVGQEEDAGARNLTTRVFNRNYEIPILDMNGDPTGEYRMETRRVMEKADGLCYDAALNAASEEINSSQWKPTNTNFVALRLGGGDTWKVETGPAKVIIASHANASPLVRYKIPYRAPVTNDNQITWTKKELALEISGGSLAYFDTETGALTLIESPRAVSGKADGNRIVFSGAYTCGDLELVYEKGRFSQNVIITNPAALPSPSTLGISPANAELRVVTDIDDVSNASVEYESHLDGGQESLSVVRGESLSGKGVILEFSKTGGKTLCSFVTSRAWIEGNSDEALIMNKTIAADAESVKNFTYSEGVPWSWIQENANETIVLDYEVRSGTSDCDEAWQAGMTYNVSSTFTVDENTLVIEGGAVVKVDDSAYISVDYDGKLKIMGTPFNYALFGKENDDIGEDITSPDTTGPDNFIVIDPHEGSSQVDIQFAKFSNCTAHAIKWDGVQTTQTPYAPLNISDTMFLDCQGIELEGTQYSEFTCTLNVFNCLFTGTHDETILLDRDFYDYQDYNIEVINCTFARGTYDGSSIAIYLDDTTSANGDVKLVVINSLFHNYRYGIECGSGISFQNSSISHNAHGVDNTSNTDALVGSTISGKLSAYISDTCDLSSSAAWDFETCDNGDYYLSNPPLPNSQTGWECNTENGNFWPAPMQSGTETGLSSDQIDRLEARTTRTPVKIDSTEIALYNSSSITRISFLNGTESCEIWKDNDAIGMDIGFHYDIVHGVISDSAVTLTRDLELKEGITISYIEDSEFRISDGEFKAVGLPGSEIRFLPTAATGDELTDPRNLDDPPIALKTQSGCDGFEIDFCRFSFFDDAVLIAISQPVTVQNSVFRENDNGVLLQTESDANASILNNLFIENASAGLYVGMNGDVDLNVVGNTFHGNGHGIHYCHQEKDTNVYRTLVEDNIFVNNDYAARSQLPGNTTLLKITRNNLLWNNATENYSSALDLTDTTNLCRANTNEANPMLCNRMRSEDDKYVMEEWDSNRDILLDGFYLAQRTDDASRRPLFIEEDDDITAMIVNDMPDEGDVYIFVMTARPIPSSIPSAQSSYRYMKNLIDGNVAQSTEGTQSAEGPLCLFIRMFAEKNPCSFGNNPWLELTLESGSKIRVYLPTTLSDTEDGGIALWIAEDGSTYWAHTDQDIGSGNYVSDLFNMDAYYASRWEDSNLARSAKVGYGSNSPAVDSGSKDYLSGGTTKTEQAGGFDRPDNDPPYKLYGFDNENANFDPIAWNATGSPMKDEGDELDMGYHYGGAGYNSSGVFTTTASSITDAVALRHPKEATVDSFNYDVGEETLEFEINPEGVKQIAIASSSYDNNGTLEEKTLACFPSSMEADQDGASHRLLLCKRFRGEATGSLTVVDHYEGGDEEESVAIDVTSVNMTTASGASGGDMEEPVYLSVSTLHYDVMPNTWKTSYLYVYRYDPTDDSWVKIASRSENMPNWYTSYQSAAVAADDNDACVFWNKNTGGAGSKIWGFRIEDAATSSGTTTISEPDNAVRTADIGDKIDADWDTNANINAPRITWTEKSGSYYNTRAALVLFHPSTNHPDSLLKNYEIYTNASYDSKNPSICVSHAMGVYNSTSDDIAEVYASCTSGDGSHDSYRIDLQASSTTDYWQTPEEHSSSAKQYEMNVSYGYLGKPRQSIIHTSNDIYVNGEKIDKNNDNQAIKITTNRNNLKDIFTAYCQGSSSDAKIIIRQLKP